MEVFSLIWDFLFGTFIRIYHYLTTWYAHASEAGFEISKGSLIWYGFWAVLMCSSSMVAMTIAEVKFRSRLAHGILGFICPVISPVVLHFVMPTLAKQEEKQEDEEQHEAAKTAVPESGLKTYRKADGTEVIPDVDVMDQEYFSRISKDEAGNLRGPFILELDDGQILEIEHVLEALAPAVAVQMGSGDEARKIRLPYTKIMGCRTKEQWLVDMESDEDDGYDEDFEERNEDSSIEEEEGV